ncbi:MAG: DUF3037 domain-containing protein [Ferruginibacter sp.]
MQEQHLFEYAVIRIVPKVEREEFFNVGVVLYCAKQQFLQMKFKLEEERLRAFCKKSDTGELKEYLDAFDRICKGGNEAGPIGKLPVAERFRWLTATRSTVVQTSKVHPGLCDDAAEMLEKLFGQLVV